MGVPCADDGGSGVGGKAAREAKIQLGCAIPHAFYSGGKAVDDIVGVGVGVGIIFFHALDDSVCGVWGTDGMAASAHEVCTCCVLRVVDGVADLTGNMAEVAGITRFVEVGFAAALEEPQEEQGKEGADYDAWYETCGKGTTGERITCWDGGRGAV